ncbi:rRNA methyltransferase [Horticoccus luteus]|uniref:rRNA methyltransferase n=1 Tax=Horticoccus luteus TaxID=2862869 RepID=A0A8F9TUJ9_9BACT|nr:SAM-dependent methyltransferase [Horticoccus luteus]QYM78049.1 rRNA methyltransferase [Horticoccus luteus]
MLLTCQAGFEALLARELTELHGATVAESGAGWVRLETALDERGVERMAMAHFTLREPVEVRGESVNALAGQIAKFFLTRLKGERIEGTWPSVWLGPAEMVGLGRRIGAVENACGEALKKRLSRVAKLATPELPRGAGAVRGLFVFFTDFGRAWVSRDAFVHGARRMADDPLAPSRSYLKVEEAYGVLGREPQAGELVVDLGAAPGGWSYSAAKRGARVLAVDNGPLKGGALDHPQIEHRREDAFRYAPAEGGVDWLFCDLVEEPHHVLQHIVGPWLARGWCRRFVVNLKFGRVDAIGLLRELAAAESPLARAQAVRVRHLFHDREEFTVVGEMV